MNYSDKMKLEIYSPSHKSIALEPRLLFDGALAVVTEQSSANIDISTSNNILDSNSNTASYREVAFVDSSLTDADKLISELSKSITVYKIEANLSGIDQIRNNIQDEHSINAVHIYSHGYEGTLNIGSDHITSDNLDSYSSKLSQLGDILAQNGDIMLYGCSIASDPTFIERFAKLTSADIAGSTNLTGSPQVGGDWALESKYGLIEAKEIVPSNYSNLLVPASYFGTSLDTGRTTFTTQITNTNTTPEFFSLDFTSSYNFSSGAKKITGTLGTEIYLKVTRNGVAANFSTAAYSNGTYYYLVDAGVNTNTWATDLAAGLKFEFFSDSACTTPTTINAFSTWTNDWGTCCTGQNPVPEGGTTAGSAVYSVFTTISDTTSINKIGAITSSINSTNHFVASIDDGNYYKSVTIVPNGYGEAFYIGGRIYFSRVGVNSIPAGYGWTPSIPPTATIAPSNGATGISYSDNITITFSEPVRNTNDSAITNDNLSSILSLKLNNSSGASIPYTATINDLKTVITINPTNDLTASSTVYVSVNGVEDADNNALTSTSSTFTVAAGGIPTGTIYPANGATGVASSLSSIVITYDEEVRLTNNTTIDNSNIDSLITLKNNSSLGTSIPFDATVNANHTVITVTPTYPFSRNQTVYVSITGLEDLSNNSASTISSTFTTAANSSPTLTTFSSNATSGQEDSQATITFNNLISSGNENDTDGTIVAFIVQSVTCGTLLIGTDSAQATAFDASSNNRIDSSHNAYWTPAANRNNPSASAFTVIAQDDDGDYSASPVQVTVSVSAVNDAPVNTVPSSQVTPEDTAIIFNASSGRSISVSDISDTQWGATDALTVTVSVASGTGSLSVTASGHGATVSNSGSSVVQLVGTAAQINAALEGLSYTPPLNASGTSYATLTVNTSDGTATDVDTIVIDVTPVNDAPVATTMVALVGPGSKKLFSEFTPTYSDTENDSPVSIKMLSLPSVGLFETYIGGVSGDRLLDSNWSPITSGVDATSPLVIAMGDLGNYRYNAGANSSGAMTVNWQIVTASSPATIGTWQSSNTASGTITVLDEATNDTPVVSLSSSSATINEDGTTSVTMTISDNYTPEEFMPFVFSSGNDRLIDVSGITVSRTSSSTFDLIFTPKTNAYGAVRLLLGTNDGNKSGSAPFDLTVTPINDTPIAYNFERTIDEDTAFSFSTVNPTLIYTDSNDANMNVNTGLVTASDGITASIAASIFPLKFVIDTLPSHGEIRLNGSQLQAGTMLNVSDLGDLTYMPSSNYFGTDSFSWHGVDQAPGGGVGLSTATKVATFTITPTNDAPIILSTALGRSITESLAGTGSLSDGGTISFLDGDLSDTHSVSTVTSSPGSLGTLSVIKTTDTTGSGTGGVLTWEYNIATSLISYLSASQSKVETYSFTVSDSNGAAVACSIEITIVGTDGGFNISQAARSGAKNGFINITRGDAFPSLSRDTFSHGSSELIRIGKNGVLVAPAVAEVRDRPLEGRSDGFAEQYSAGHGHEVVRHAVLEGAQLASAVRKVTNELKFENKDSFLEVPVAPAYSVHDSHETPFREKSSVSYMETNRNRFHGTNKHDATHSPVRSSSETTSIESVRSTVKGTTAQWSFSEQLKANRNINTMIVISDTKMAQRGYRYSALEQALLTLDEKRLATDKTADKAYMTPIEKHIMLGK